MSQISCYKSQQDLVTLGGVGGEIRNVGKRLEWRDWDETWWVE